MSPKTRTALIATGTGIAGLLFGSFAGAFGDGESAEPKVVTETITAKPSPVPTVTVTAEPSVATEPEPAPAPEPEPEPGIGNGDHIISTDIAPGRYRFGVEPGIMEWCGIDVIYDDGGYGYFSAEEGSVIVTVEDRPGVVSVSGCTPGVPA